MFPSCPAVVAGPRQAGRKEWLHGAFAASISLRQFVRLALPVEDEILPAHSGPEEVCRRFRMDEAACGRMRAYVEALAKWNACINLVAPATLPQAWVRHVADGLQLLPLLREAGIRKVIDLGSGSGVPGLVMALAAPDLDVHLVESTARKCAFLRQVAQACGIDVNIHQRRIEALEPEIFGAGPETAVTARALAPLPRLLEMAAPLLAQGGTAVLPKGRRAALELQEARRAGWRFESQLKPSVTDAEGKIIVLRGVGRDRG